ncbi:MAG: hypothetical protein IKD79_01920, partial [Oscillospiraceae bacterium]|nr:hypothetical protein [Oscillospiraceae bacterium]
SRHRLRSEMEVIPIPLSYESWSFDAPNFGPTREEYESLGIDLSAWYAVHPSSAAGGSSYSSVDEVLDFLGF